MDRAPPPPYTETDVYSNVGTGVSLDSRQSHLAPSSSHADTTSLTSQPYTTAASSVDEVIYTPPYSPSESLHQNQTLCHNLEHVASSAAAFYFDSRPAHSHISGPPTTHTIQLTSSTEPKDLPFPHKWEEKDVSEQDWATFMNFLLPDHVTTINNEVADRKLKAELMDEEMQQLTLGQDDGSRAGLDRVDAQLEHLRHPQSKEDTERMLRAEVTLSEWNEGFFKPRGLQITLIGVESTTIEEPQMPGSWIPWEHEIESDSLANNRGIGRKGFFSGFRSFSGTDGTSSGFRMGPIVADNQGFRIGKNGIVADGNGFRMGSRWLVADQNGIRLGGSRGFVADGSGVSMGSRLFGKRDSESEMGRGRFDVRDQTHLHGRRRPRRRDRSSGASSLASSSSSSSVESDSSFGSLPEEDDLEPQQLPAAKKALMEWLFQPSQSITKEGVQQIQEEILAAQSDSPASIEDEDLEALRKEVRNLMKLFKDGKRAQRKQRRDSKRDRRALKRAHRAERRNAKKEARKCRKEPRNGKNKDEGRTFLPWTKPCSPCSPADTTGSSVQGGPPTMPGFPFARAASVPFLKSSAFSRGIHSSHQGMSAIHAGWPFTQSSPYKPGNASGTHLPHEDPAFAFSRGAENIHTQALEMIKAAEERERQSMILRTAATHQDVERKEKFKMLDEATAFEEEADEYRREADRLRAEALHLDSELAKELEQEHSND